MRDRNDELDETNSLFWLMKLSMVVVVVVVV